MGWFKLAPSRLHHLKADAIIYDKDESGEQKVISVSQPADLSDEQVAKLQQQGHRLVETEEPEETEEVQPVGADVIGMSPIVATTGTSTPSADEVASTPGDTHIDQQAGQEQVNEEDNPQAH